MITFIVSADVQENRRIEVTLPPEVPTGHADLIISVASETEKSDRRPRTNLADWADENAEHWGNRLDATDVEELYRPEILIVPSRSVLPDTSFILALENRDDPVHDRAKLLGRELTASQTLLVLYWGILLEIGDGYARLGRRAKGTQLLDRFQHEEGYDIQPITEPLFQEALALYPACQDKEWGLTDCVSFVLMRRLGISDALTADVHFRQAGFTALLLD